MGAAVGTTSFANAHCYAIFSRDISSVTGAATKALQWAALRTLFPATAYVNKAAKVTLPVQTAKTFPVENMGAEADELVAGLPSLSEGMIEVGWINETGNILTLRDKSINDDIAVALIQNTDDAATKGDPLRNSTQATAAVFGGTVAANAPIPAEPNTRAMIRVTIVSPTKVFLTDHAV